MPKKDELYYKYNKLTPDQKEMVLVAENNYPNKSNAIYDNYMKKIKSGKYDYEKSIKGYLNLVTPARREMVKEQFYKEGGWQFKPSDDKKVAEILALQFYEQNKKEIKPKKESKRKISSRTTDKLMKMEKKGLI